MMMIIKTLTIITLLESVLILCAHSHKYCDKVDIKNINVILQIDDDALIYPNSPYYALNKIMYNYDYAHFNGSEMKIFCKVVANKVYNTKALLLNNIKLKDVESGAWDELHYLQYVAIIKNNIPNFNISIKSLKNLKFISLQDNKIEDIKLDKIDDLPELHTLDLSINNISEIKNWCKNCPKLTKIKLNRNRIRKIPVNAFTTISNDSSIEIILDNNQIEEIESGALNQLRDIRLLSLANNKLKDLPEDFLNNLQNGYELNLSNNLLRDIPKHVLHKFRYVDLNDNPLTDDFIRDFNSTIVKPNIP